MFGFKSLGKLAYLIVGQLFSLLRKHITIHLYAFDSIHDIPAGVELSKLPEYRQTRVTKEAATIHNYFLLQLGIWAFLFSDTLWLYTKHAMPFKSNPYVFTHRMYAPSFWAKGDMLVLAVSTGILLFGLTFSLRKWLDDRYCMYVLKDENQKHQNCILIVNGEIWNTDNAEKILKFRAKVRSASPFIMILSVLVCGLFFGFNFLHTPFNDWVHHFKLWIYLPFLSYYLIFSAVLVMVHFYVITQYVIYKQSHLLKLQLQLLNEIRSAKPNSLTRLYRRFHSLQAHFAYQCAEIVGYNVFWRVPLSIVFAVEIATFCYLLYSCLFDVLPIDAFIYFFFFMIELGAFFFVVIFRASIVDHNNDRAYERNVHMAVLFQLADLPIGSRLHVNIERLATNRNFSRCCFRLANGFRVDSTAFQMALYIVSTFFLMICRNNRRAAEM